jgi:hypothetical protein
MEKSVFYKYGTQQDKNDFNLYHQHFIVELTVAAWSTILLTQQVLNI